MTLTAIVIDDSTLQRVATGRLIENHPNLRLMGTYSDPKKGLEAVNKFQPDVLFLDIEMPGLGGFEVLELLECDCQVILNSTRSQFALHAFQYDQVKDFLVKPMNKPRFEKSVEKAIKNVTVEKVARPAMGQFVWMESLSKAS